MRVRLEVIRALRLNYRWRGVYVWLKGRNCFNCGGKGKVVMCTLRIEPVIRTGSGSFNQQLKTCSRCSGSPLRGYQRILHEPERVTQEQHATAEGVFL